jgi:uncharacterized membrane protein YbhN (UPF0104 family)
MSAVTRRRLVRLAQLAIVALVLWRATLALGGPWAEFRGRGGVLRADWGLAALSALVVLATYALLIEAWRLVVRAWGGHLGFGTAARIWSVSNLGRYLPGKVWSIAAMGLLARRAGVSAVAATGSSILVTLVNVAAGFAVLLLAGSRALALVAPGEAGKRLAVSVALAVTAGLVVLPWALPSLARLAVRLLRREVVLPTIAPEQLWLVVLANVAAWFGYGAAFLLLGRAVLPGSASVVLSAGSWLDATAVFTASYLAGYLALVVPGGLGVRELAMVAVLTGLGITGNVEAWLLALASRLWLTVLELLPGLLFLARDAVVRSPSTTPDAPS